MNMCYSLNSERLLLLGVYRSIIGVTKGDSGMAQATRMKKGLNPAMA